MFPDELSTVEYRLGYTFADRSRARLATCFKAAHRSDRDGIAEDGNRALAMLGVSVIDLVELHCSCIANAETRYIAQERSKWAKSKSERANVCKVLGFSSYITCSVRQGDSPPSIAVLASAMSAIVAAIWEDMGDRGRTLRNATQETAALLARIGVRSLGSLPINPAHLTLAGSQDVTMGSNLDWPQAINDLATVPAAQANTYSPRGADGLCPDSETPSMEPDSEGSVESIRRLGVEDGYRLSNAEVDVSNDSLGALIPLNPSSDTVLSASLSAWRETTVGSTAGNSETAISPPTDLLTVSLHSQANEAIRHQLIAEDICKHRPDSNQAELRGFLILLDHDDIARISPTGNVEPLRLLYYMIGSSQSLLSFREVLVAVRKNMGVGHGSSDNTISYEQHMRRIEELYQTTATSSFLTRCHIAKLFKEDPKDYSNAANFIVNTPAAFSNSCKRASGNPLKRAIAANTDMKMRRLYPHLEPRTPAYESKRRFLLRLRRVAARLYCFTEVFGFGILAFLPHARMSSNVHFTDEMLEGIDEATLQKLVELLRRYQGSFLSSLSAHVEPILEELVQGRLNCHALFKFERCPAEWIQGLSKGSPELISCFE